MPATGNRPPDRLRIQATPGRRRLATALEWAVILAMLGLVWSGARLVGLLWDQRGDPEVGRVLWLFAGLLVLAVLTLGWLVVLLQDLVKIAIDVDDRGVTVDRLRRAFSARWDEIHEIGVVTRLGHLTLRSARGDLTTTARLLGPAPFAALVDALRGRAGSLVREWSPWAATRRQVLLLAIPALGALLLLLLARALLGRRGAVSGPRR